MFLAKPEEEHSLSPLRLSGEKSFAFRWKSLHSHRKQKMKENKETIEMKHSLEEIEKCIAMLEGLAKDAGGLANLPEKQRIALLKVTGEISRPDRAERKKRNKAANKIQSLATLEKDRRARNSTGIRSARIDETFTAPKQIELLSPGIGHEEEELNSPRNCYVCKEEFTKLHFFYDTMCKKCGDLNYRKRFQTASLHGQVALITGSRVKIGYQATLLMLRAGATVIATTRFPVDAALRYSKEEGYAEWGDRLHIHGLDLRHIPSVEIFTRYVEQRYGRLDILINNAAQTVRRPPGFYAHLIDNEINAYKVLSSEARKLLSDHEACKKQLASFCPHDGQSNPHFLLHGMIRDPASACVNPPNFHRSLIHMIGLSCLRKYFQKAGWMPTFNRWTCARPTAGACAWEKYQPRKCLKSNW